MIDNQFDFGFAVDGWSRIWISVWTKQSAMALILPITQILGLLWEVQKWGRALGYAQPNLPARGKKQ
ncbi:MAG: hypothetical protein CM15mP21_7470 [Hyphomicrobiales bacterium]|nr:MAG: hypothetical protein CM15mP21_7470 [Hyphomicrobiales bacterium]